MEEEKIIHLRNNLGNCIAGFAGISCRNLKLYIK